MNDSVFTMETVPLKFGWGALDEAGADAAALGLKRVLLLTDQRVAAAGYADQVAAGLRAADVGVSVYAAVQCEPSEASWQAAIEAACSEPFDGFVAVGGGSTIDTAKAANLYSTYPADLRAYISAPLGEGRTVPGPLKPLIAIPTTAGTGSETTSVAVLDLVSERIKTGISHRLLRPRLAIVDPQTTMTLPRLVTASCGLDVLCHALESYTTKPYNERPKPASPTARPPYVGSNPIADVWCEAAIRRIGSYLKRACDDPTDREARENVMLASVFAGMGFGNAGVHIPHAMSYPVAGLVRDYQPPDYPDDHPLVPHGISVALGAPATFRFMMDTMHDRQHRALDWLGVDVAHLPPPGAPFILSDTLARMVQDLGLPDGFRALGYTEADIPGLVAGTMKQQRLLVNAPKPVTEASLKEIFTASMKLSHV